MRTLRSAAVAAGADDTHVFSPRSRRRVIGPTGRRCHYVRKTQLEMAAAASAGHTRPPRDRNLKQGMVLGLPNPFKPKKEGSTGMTVPATADIATPAGGMSQQQGPGSSDPRPRTLVDVLNDVHQRAGITDSAFRFFSLVIGKIGVRTFTVQDAAAATGYSDGSAGTHLGYLVNAGVLSSKRMDLVVDGSSRRARVYWLAGGYR